MAKGWRSIPTSHFLLLCLVIMGTDVHFAEAGAVPPAIYIFGDSTVDVGTNNFVPGCRAQARANYPFNGIDFPNSTATGRFSNGFNLADQIAMHFQYEMSPPPFFQLLKDSNNFQKNILQGVNFASGGSGLLSETGQYQFRKVISMGEQIQQFAIVQDNITGTLGQEKASSLLSKSLFLITAGSNDIFEYHGFNNTLPKPEFMDFLQSAYKSHLQNLYNLGARKFGIMSIGPLGCCPFQRVSNKTGGCMEILNDSAQEFHSKIETLLQQLSSELVGMKYSVGNAYEMTMRIITTPPPFKDVQTACCGNGKHRCSPRANLCPNRDEYLFWDRFHPTQFASNFAAAILYEGGPPFVIPINLSRLIQGDV